MKTTLHDVWYCSCRACANWRRAAKIGALGLAIEMATLPAAHWVYERIGLM